MSRRVHLTLMSPGRFTWKPSVSWVVGSLCHWGVGKIRGGGAHKGYSDEEVGREKGAGDTLWSMVSRDMGLLDH